ncbi:hypothetical protein QBC41DRAFT_397822 [Cercophora samala]|uniref:C2H2-type domain-containing protein n=1 Tax=Cercophora samala TaxID=330535 RepID=A0AA40DAQ2_9PEZI|nr:hypothetical protein QBC41DRAFT_397822 [Cercophora samala]
MFDSHDQFPDWASESGGPPDLSKEHPWAVGSHLEGQDIGMDSNEQGDGTVNPAFLTMQRGPGAPATTNHEITGSAMAMPDSRHFGAEMLTEAPEDSASVSTPETTAVSFETVTDNEFAFSFPSSQSSDNSSTPEILTPNESDYSSDWTALDSLSFSFNSPVIDLQPADFTDQVISPLMPNDFPVAADEQHFIVYPLPASATKPLSETNPAKSEVRYTIVDGKFKCLYSACKGSNLYNLPGELRKHQKNHRRPTRCEICGEGYAERKDLDRHRLKDHGDHASVRNDKRAQKQKKRCEVCGRTQRADNLKRHMLVHGRS